MTRPGSGASTRTLRLVLWAQLAGQIAAGAIAVALVYRGHTPVLGPRTERIVAYAWVAFTIAAAYAGYRLARGHAGSPVSFARALAASALTDLAALAGFAAFYLVKIWPMLAVAVLAALLGVAIAYPRGAAAVAEESTAGERPAEELPPLR